MACPHRPPRWPAVSAPYRWRRWAVTATRPCLPGWTAWVCRSTCTTSWPADTEHWSVSRPCGSWRLSMWVWACGAHTQTLAHSKDTTRPPGVIITYFMMHNLRLQVLKIALLGHRKRIIASLAERPYEEPPVKPPRLSQIRVRKDFTLQVVLRSIYFYFKNQS